MTSLETGNWWTRLLERLAGRSPKGADLPRVGEDGLLSEPLDAVDAEAAPERPAGALARWSKRDQTLMKLQEGYERVTQVVEEVQKHLAQQGERTERICVSLEQLSRAMSEMPESSRQQTATLQSIAGQLETTGARTQQMAEAVSEMPKAARIQSETLAGIKRQMELTGEQNLVTGQSLEKLGAAISALGEFNSAQADALREMNAQASRQTEVLANLVARQSRRFVMLFVVTVVLAVMATGGAIATALILRGA